MCAETFCMLTELLPLCWGKGMAVVGCCLHVHLSWGLVSWSADGWGGER